MRDDIWLWRNILNAGVPGFEAAPLRLDRIDKHLRDNWLTKHLSLQTPTMDEYVLPPNLSEELVGAEPEEDRLPSYDELSPAYDSQAHRQCMEHAFPLPGNCRSQPTLRLASSASSSRNVPLYTPGDSVITGTFDLDMHPGANFNVEGIDIKVSIV